MGEKNKLGTIRHKISGLGSNLEQIKEQLTYFSQMFSLTANAINAVSRMVYTVYSNQETLFKILGKEDQFSTLESMEDFFKEKEEQAKEKLLKNMKEDSNFKDFTDEELKEVQEAADKVKNQVREEIKKAAENKNEEKNTSPNKK